MFVAVKRVSFSPSIIGNRGPFTNTEKIFGKYKLSIQLQYYIRNIVILYYNCWAMSNVNEIDGFDLENSFCENKPWPCDKTKGPRFRRKQNTHS